MSSQRRSKREDTRERIIEAAFRLFVERGYHGTSMRQIAQRAGIALGAAYNHFPGKEELFVAVLAERHPYLAIVPALAEAQGETVEALVRNAAARMLQGLGERLDGLSLVFIELVEFEGRHIPQLSGTVLPYMMSFAQRFAQNRDILRPIPPGILLRSFVGLFFSYFMTQLLMRDQFPAEQEVNALDAFVDIYLHGILARPEERKE